MGVTAIFRSWRGPLLAGAAAALALAGCTSTPTAQPSPTAAVPVTSAAPTSAAPAASTTDPPSSASPTSTQPNKPQTSGPHEPTPGDFQGVQLVRTGGIAGITETITVLPDGSWTVKSSRGATRSGKLGTTQKSRLQALLSDSRLAAEATRKTTSTGRCSDAFTYLLVAGHQLVRYTSCGGSDKPEVTVAVISLLQSATKGQ
jgi:hypothetical protein